MPTLVRDLLAEIAHHQLIKANTFADQHGFKFLFLNRTCSNALWRNFRNLARVEIDMTRPKDMYDVDPEQDPNFPCVRIFTDAMVENDVPNRELSLIVSVDIFKIILKYHVVRRIKNFVITPNWRNEVEIIKLLDLIYDSEIESIGHLEILLNAEISEFWFGIARILHKYSPLDFTCCSEKILKFLNEEMQFKKFTAGKWMSKFNRRHVPIPQEFNFLKAEFFSLALADHMDHVVLRMLSQIQAETIELYSLDGHWSIVDVAKSMEVNPNHPVKNFMWFVNTRQCAFLAETLEAILVVLPRLEYFTIVNALQENLEFFRNEFLGSELLVLDSTLLTIKNLLNSQNHQSNFTFQALYRITVYDLEDCYILLDRLLQTLSRHSVVKKVAEYRDHFDSSAEPKTDLPDIKILDLDALMSIPFTESERAGNLNEIKHEIFAQISEERVIKVDMIITYTQKDTYDFT